MRLKFEGEDHVKLSPRVLVTQQDKKRVRHLRFQEISGY